MYCGTLGIISAIRSPRCKPLDWSQAARGDGHLIDLGEADCPIHANRRGPLRVLAEGILQHVHQGLVLRHIDFGGNVRRIVLQPRLEQAHDFSRNKDREHIVFNDA